MCLDICLVLRSRMLFFSSSCSNRACLRNHVRVAAAEKETTRISAQIPVKGPSSIRSVITSDAPYLPGQPSQIASMSSNSTKEGRTSYEVVRDDNVQLSKNNSKLLHFLMRQISSPRHELLIIIGTCYGNGLCRWSSPISPFSTVSTNEILV